MPFDRRNHFDLMFLFQDQLLRNIEQCLELFEVGVLGDEQIFLVVSRDELLPALSLT